ncbi:MAG: hypothetical protein AAB658_20310 [Chloroflexota bacterium]
MAEKTLDLSANQEKAGKKPYFIWWEQNITEEDVREAIKGDNLYRRITYMSYVLNDAKFEDIWKFVTLKDVQKEFWRIRWRTTWLRDHWHQLLTLLDYRPDECADPIAARILE